jgi:ferric-dicitrate binding protein FerR (iron transport regulator)
MNAYDMKEIYKTYSLLELLEINDFTKWIKNTSLEEIERLYQDDPDFKSRLFAAKSIIASTSPEIPAFDENRIWSKINEATLAKPQMKIVKSPPSRRLGLGVAASLLILMVSGLYYFIGSDTTIRTGYIEATSVTLPDGSKVELNANSKLEYDRDFTKARVIKLQGEAFFSVKKGSSFTVQTESGDVKVLGTSFNVYARDKNLNVICKTGKVSVTTKQGLEKILTPDQMVAFQNGMLSDTAPTDRSTWMGKTIHYEKAKLSEVLTELRHIYGVTIKTSMDINTMSYNGDIPLNDLDKALQSVTWPFRLKYKQASNEVEIYQ